MLYFSVMGSVMDFIEAIRQNHALEHGTMTILMKKLGKEVRMMGRSSPTGFYIYGDIPTDIVKEAAEEALRRLKAGEEELAISPFCGTNAVVTGILATFASLIALSGKNKLLKIPRAILAAILVGIFSHPIGRLVQKYLTTTNDLSDVKIERVEKRGEGDFIYHKIETKRHWV